MEATVRLEHSLLALEGEHDVHAMFELTVPPAPESAGQPPLRLALVLDRSGSMGGPKLEIAKRCARWLVSRLRDQDELALVDFDDEVRLLVPLGAGQSDAIDATLNGIHPGGSTNLSGGWLRGAEQLRGTNGGGIRKVLLLTDGLANVGIVDPVALVGLAAQAGGDGIGTTTIGFGGGFDEDLLTAMADAGGGNAHYAETPDAAPAIFADELEGLSRVVAQNVSVEIRPHESVQIVGVLNEYPQVEVPGGVQVELGDAYGGEKRRVVFGLHIPHVAELGPVPVAELVLRYVAVGESIEQRTLTIPLVANAVSADEAAAATPDADVVEEVLVLRAARARDKAIEAADQGDTADAQRILAENATSLAPYAASNAKLASEVEALQIAQARIAREYDPRERKRLKYESNVRRRGRNGPNA